MSGLTQEYGDIVVTNTAEETFSNYVRRSFEVTRGDVTRNITQFQYTKWVRVRRVAFTCETIPQPCFVPSPPLWLVLRLDVP
jgi:hypothetical protein